MSSQDNINNISKSDINSLDDLKSMNPSDKLDNESINNIAPFSNFGKDTNFFTTEFDKDQIKNILPIYPENSKKLGRKRKDDETPSAHNKFSNDIIRKKIKTLIIKELQSFINRKIVEIYGEDAGEGMVRKRLMKLSGEQNSNTLEFMKEFLNKTLLNIFSGNVTSGLIHYSKDTNIKLINDLINDKIEQRSSYFKGLFNITFLDCLKYFRGENVCKEYLKGLNKFSHYIKKNEVKLGKDYIEHLSAYLHNYEKNIFKKLEND
jgi:hypothetical protein